MYLRIDHLLAEQLKQKILKIYQAVESHRLTSIDYSLNIWHEVLDLLQTAKGGRDEPRTAL